MTLAEFSSLLTAHNCKPTGNGKTLAAKCPAHDDGRASLSVSTGADGRLLVKCHAGCATEAVCAALGINLADLFEDKPQRNGQPKKIVAAYDYTDASGKLIFQVCRYKPKDFKQRRPDGKGGWIWNMAGIDRVLFRLPELRGEIERQMPVFVCEGEKDVLAMVKHGFSATTNAGGAGKWQNSYNETLRGADVVIVADKDAAGRKHAADVAGKLHGVALTVKIIELPDVAGQSVKDASDFFAAGGQAADSDELAQATPEFISKPKDPTNTTTAQSAMKETCRPLQVEPPATPMDFNKWESIISAHFPMFARPAEICASVVAQLLLNDVANPFALALVDVPSSGKTITLNFFDVSTLAYTTDNFTPASFVSHASNIKREELAKVDMLPRIRYRTLIVRDLAPIFGVKEDELLKTMGILTRALDGEGLEIDSGVHGKRGYKGDWLFMLLAGTTPIPPRVFKIMGTLGSRLFFLALHSNAKNHNELIAQSSHSGLKADKMQRISSINRG